MSISFNGTSGLTFPDASTQATGGYTGFRNRIINGGMTIDQRNAGASVTPTSSGYTLDRYTAQLTQASKLSIQQNAGSVTPPVGFAKYLGCTSLSAYSVASGDYFRIDQFIEGLNVADLGFGTANAATVTLSFWVRSSLTGTFGGVVANNAFNRCYPFTYTISSANTWEQKTVTIAGDTTGTWLTDNGIGLRLSFSLGAGSTYSGTAGAWSGSTLTTATGATSVVGTNGATFYITGVQLEKGSVATPFEFRPYGQELQLCQRYYWRVKGSESSGGTTNNIAEGAFSSSTSGFYFVRWPVIMRASPTVNGTASGFTMRNIGSGADGVNASLGIMYDTSTTSTGINATCASSGATADRNSWLTLNAASSYFDASAEL